MIKEKESAHLFVLYPSLFESRISALCLIQAVLVVSVILCLIWIFTFNSKPVKYVKGLSLLSTKTQMNCRCCWVF